MSRIALSYSQAQNHIFFESEALGRYRIFPKGRRLGATRGAAHAFIEYMLEGRACMWGDTINANITRYIERYFLPPLKTHHIPYQWDKWQNHLRVGPGFTDFRSADKPENWEGFGYHVMFLNEAGIILNDEYLFNNAVLPMLIDYPESTLIAAGTPKLRQGKGRLFQTLWGRVQDQEEGYTGKRFTTYDNPFIAREQIELLERDIPAADREQEIYGRFIEAKGNRVKREWILYGRPQRRVKRALGVDLAISTKETTGKKGPDYTALVIMDTGDDGNEYVRHAMRRRVSFQETAEWIKETCAHWQPTIVGIESVQYQSAIVQHLLSTTTLPVWAVTRDSRDKVTRFNPIELRYEQGLIRHEPGIARSFEDELLAFPDCDFDDQVDALETAWTALRRSSKGPAAAGSRTF